jgi:adenosylcobyric acid synthase
VLLPGSKSTIADLEALRREGWDIDIAAHLRRGGRVLGLCGGYQMLGRTISDPHGVEGPPRTVAGLGLLGVETELAAEKTTVEATGTHCATGVPLAGYEIHMGRTAGPDCARPFAEIEGRTDGAVSADGRVAGTYLHGLFAGDSFRKAFLASFGAPAAAVGYEAAVEAALDGWAAHLVQHLDVERVWATAQSRERRLALPRQSP